MAKLRLRYARHEGVVGALSTSLLYYHGPETQTREPNNQTCQTDPKDNTHQIHSRIPHTRKDTDKTHPSKEDRQESLSPPITARQSQTDQHNNDEYHSYPAVARRVEMMASIKAILDPTIPSIAGFANAESTSTPVFLAT
jgi:hypothetical protein